MAAPGCTVVVEWVQCGVSTRKRCVRDDIRQQWRGGRVIMRLFKRSATSAPYHPRRVGPSQPGAYLFTLRSVPRHHDGIKTAIESTGNARCYFSEPLAYLRGQGVSLFRVEATRIDFLDNLHRWWRETEAREAFTFDIALYFNNTDFVASLKDTPTEEIRRLIEADAPHTPADPEDFKRTPRL